MTFNLCSHVCPMMTLKWDKSSTTENYTFWITSLAWTSSTTSPREVVKAPLNLDSIRPGFSRVDGGNPICLNADIYNKSTKLPRSTKIRLTSKSVIPNVRIRASSWCCSTQLGSTRGNVIIPSMGRMPPLGKPIWRELTCSLTEAA